jgi:endothelin-converting enzyme
MDKKSAKAASEKADAIRIKVGYPVSPDTMNPASIANYYRTVKIDKGKFLENMLSASYVPPLDFPSMR